MFNINITFFGLADSNIVYVENTNKVFQTYWGKVGNTFKNKLQDLKMKT